MSHGHHHVAIAGAGYSGTAAFVQLVNQLPQGQKATISVVETGPLGPGSAYGSDNPTSYLMNTPAWQLNVSTDQDDAMMVWLDKNLERLRETYPGLENSPSAFLPRRLFGEYLASKWTSYLSKARDRGIRVDVYRQQATDFELNPSGTGGRLKLGDGTILEIDTLVVSVGIWRSTTLEHLKKAGLERGCVVVDHHIPGHELEDLPLDATVGILGASQSALDVMCRLFSPATGARFERTADGELTFVGGPNQRRVTLCSRSGRFPVAHPPTKTNLVRVTQFSRKDAAALVRDGKLDLAKLGALITAEARAAGIAVNWDDLLEPYWGLTQAEANAKTLATLEDELRSVREHRMDHPTVYLYRLTFTLFPLLSFILFNEVLSVAEQAAARQMFDPIFRLFVGPSPPETLERVTALMKAGRLELRLGVQAPVIDGDSFRIDHKSPSGDVGSLRVRYLVNAIGILADRKLERFDNPLVRALFARNVFAPYQREGVPLGGINFDPWTMRAIGPSGEISKCVYVIGELVRGRSLMANAVGVLRVNSDTAVRSIIVDSSAGERPPVQPTPLEELMAFGGRAAYFPE